MVTQRDPPCAIRALRSRLRGTPVRAPFTRALCRAMSGGFVGVGARKRMDALARAHAPWCGAWPDAGRLHRRCPFRACVQRDWGPVWDLFNEYSTLRNKIKAAEEEQQLVTSIV